MYPDSCGPPNKFHTSSTEQKTSPTPTLHTCNTRGSHQEQSIGYEPARLKYDMIYDMIWYDIWYDMIWYMIWYMICYSAKHILPTYIIHLGNDIWGSNFTIIFDLQERESQGNWNFGPMIRDWRKLFQAPVTLNCWDRNLLAIIC